MSGQLQWRSGIRDDRAALHSFECTTPPIRLPFVAKSYHPKPWEHKVQGMVRSLKPPFRPPKFMLVGLDDRGIAAVTHYEELDGPGRVELTVMAVARRCRGQGGRYADEAVQETISTMIDRAEQADVKELTVTSVVHESNRASGDMCLRAGMADMGAIDAEWHFWSGTQLL